MSPTIVDASLRKNTEMITRDGDIEMEAFYASLESTLFHVPSIDQ